MDKNKLGRLVEIGKNIPMATLETAMLASIPAGIITASIGSGITYLVGYPEMARNLFLGGSVVGIGGFTALFAYAVFGSYRSDYFTIEFEETHLEKIEKEVKKYKEISKPSY